ncbi:aldo/keto reductase [Amphritea pacifica]|uniref:Aldo/keto reductase n=1 Tax=Amphritea pacifica TaxID=2811233 RepID=A0ABS2W9U5_9GAMM|nr:aldo/keto reductase [Amphritea pacifica]MBN0988380.1 aldo/keto reductase [Amphritea pacifica]MBN1006636.1 aldo/keto reductase [Amphritea pacifica]
MLTLRPIPGTDLIVSPIGLGTVKLGRDKGVKYPSRFTIPDDKQAARLLDLSRDLGINLLDTAPAYGNSETRLGPLLLNQRHHWLICSKVGEEFDPQTGESHFNFTPEHVRFSIERSLKRLRTDVIDILLVHSDGNDLDIINHYGILEQLEQLKSEGKIRAGGMSTKTIEGGIETLKRSDIAMVTYNLDYRDEQPVIDYALAAQKGIFIKKALASGHIAQASEADPVRASFDLVLGHQGVSSAIIGTINPDHLRANVMAAVESLKAGPPND